MLAVFGFGRDTPTTAATQRASARTRMRQSRSCRTRVPSSSGTRRTRARTGVERPRSTSTCWRAATTRCTVTDSRCSTRPRRRTIRKRSSAASRPSTGAAGADAPSSTRSGTTRTRKTADEPPAARHTAGFVGQGDYARLRDVLRAFGEPDVWYLEDGYPVARPARPARALRRARERPDREPRAPGAPPPGPRSPSRPASRTCARSSTSSSSTSRVSPVGNPASCGAASTASPRRSPSPPRPAAAPRLAVCAGSVGSRAPATATGSSRCSRRSSTAAPTAAASTSTGRWRWARAACRSSTSPAATSRSRTRTARSSSSRTARSTTIAELRRELERAGHVFRTHCDTEVHLHLYEEHGPGVRATSLRGMFAVAVWDAPRSASCSHATASASSRSTTATRGHPRVRVGAARAARRGEIDPDAVEAFLAFNSIPAPYSIFKDIRKLPPGHVLVLRGERRDATHPLLASGPARGAARRRRGGARRGAAGAAARLGPRAPALRRPRRRHALGRRRLRRAGGSRRGSDERACPHVHDRVRGAKLRRARRRAPCRRAVLHGSPRAARPTGPAAAVRDARPRLRRAVRRLVGVADVSRVGARGRPCEGRPLRRGRRRTFRRVLHLRSRSARRALRRARVAGAPARRASADVDREGELRLQGETVRARRTPTVARTSSRLEGDLLARPARGAARRPSAFDPVDVYRARYAETAGAPSSPACRTSTSASTSSTTCS